MDRNCYLKDPCRASSLPYWKSTDISIPKDLMILRDDAFEERAPGYEDTPFFKLIHRLNPVDQPFLPRGFDIVPADTELLCKHISVCYRSERVTAEELEQYKCHRTYHPDLWIAVADTFTGEIAASGIAELDGNIGEGILEWIEVSPEFRRRGLGKFLVNELLFRMKDMADFVTVSGRLHDPSNPLAFYESCGFNDCVIWHILRKK